MSKFNIQACRLTKSIDTEKPLKLIAYKYSVYAPRLFSSTLTTTTSFLGNDNLNYILSQQL